jgi:hypothetical protein
MNAFRTYRSNAALLLALCTTTAAAGTPGIDLALS